MDVTMNHIMAALRNTPYATSSPLLLDSIRNPGPETEGARKLLMDVAVANMMVQKKQKEAGLRSAKGRRRTPEEARHALEVRAIQQRLEASRKEGKGKGKGKGKKTPPPGAGQQQPPSANAGREPAPPAAVDGALQPAGPSAAANPGVGVPSGRGRGRSQPRDSSRGRDRSRSRSELGRGRGRGREETPASDRLNRHAPPQLPGQQQPQAPAQPEAQAPPPPQGPGRNNRDNSRNRHLQNQQ